MSSRVQKGGQKFRPVAKPRGKPGEGLSAPTKKPLSTRETSQAQTSHTLHVPLEIPPQTLNTASLGGEVVVVTPSDANTSPTVIEDAPSFDAPSAQHLSIDPIIPVAPSSSSFYNTGRIGGEQTGLKPKAIQIPSSLRSTTTTSSSLTQPSLIPQFPDGPTIASQETGFISPETVNALQTLLQNLVRPEAQQETPSPSTLVNSQGPSTTTSPATTLVPQDQLPYDLLHHTQGGGHQFQQVDKIHEQTIGHLSTVKPKGVLSDNRGESNAEIVAKPTPKPRRKRVVKQKSNSEEQLALSETEEYGGEDGTQAPRKRRRRTATGSSTSSRGRRSRTSSAIIFDPDADPGEDLDPTVVTMASICDDTGQGRVSSKAAIIMRNHLAWKAANREKRAKMRAAVEAKKYGRKEDDEAAENETIDAQNDNAENGADTEVRPDSQEELIVDADNDANVGGFNYGEVHSTNRFTARVRIGPNGETIIDNDSLVVDRHENEDETENYQHVEESDQTKFVNSATYGKKVRGSRWSAEETEEFYDALSQFGVNFELISYVLPGRDRNSCKNKYKTEDKRNPGRVKYCLDNPIPYDIRRLSKFTKKDFSGPTPEIRVPEKPVLVENTQQEVSPVQERSIRKRSKTPALDDVEVVGDVETFDAG